jgi:hypothetical protein
VSFTIQYYIRDIKNVILQVTSTDRHILNYSLASIPSVTVTLLCCPKPKQINTEMFRNYYYGASVVSSLEIRKTALLVKLMTGS